MSASDWWKENSTDTVEPLFQRMTNDRFVNNRWLRGQVKHKLPKNARVKHVWLVHTKLIVLFLALVLKSVPSGDFFVKSLQVMKSYRSEDDELFAFVTVLRYFKAVIPTSVRDEFSHSSQSVGKLVKRRGTGKDLKQRLPNCSDVFTNY